MLDDFNSIRQPYCSPGLRGVLESKHIASCCVLITIAGLLFGYEQGAMTVVLVESQFLARFWQINNSGFYKGFLTAILELGALVGAFNQGWIADTISRKYAVMIATIIFIIGSILQTLAMEYSLLALARFVGGIGIGMLSMVAPLYISEVSPSSIRGTLLVLQELSIVIGIVLAFWLTYATRLIVDDWAFRLPFLLQILPALILAVGVFYLPFSPRWLAMQGRNDEALTSLSMLRQLPKTDKRVLLEWCDIRAEVMLHEEIRLQKHPKTNSILSRETAVWTELFGSSWPRTQLGIGIMFFQQFVGINALIYYAPTLLGLLGLDHDMQLKMAGIVNMAQLLGVVSSLWTMDKFGRRQLLLWGSISMFLCQFIIAILVANYGEAWPEHTAQAWLCITLLLVYMVTFGSGWGPVPWSLPSEIFPNSLRARGVAVSACSNWLNNFVIGLLTPVLVQRTGHGAYVFFALFCLLSFAWVYFLVPETTGKTLEELDDLFHDTTDGQLEESRRRQIQRQLYSACEGEN